ncbi:uncharacterized protein BDV17DRAFT_196728 [Aspergillus undulatus]|uniref:uncharacterized protein n=1 Tax=Aspergillus undulatus TaxID=1810928 RepID=UPI003CCDA232
MTKGCLGKPRTPPQAQGISKPYLRYTDALPRNDLRDIDRNVSYSRPVVNFGQSDSRNQSPVPDFEFGAAVPTSQSTLASDTNLGVDESMIGIALGSPRMLEPNHIATAPRIPPPTPPDDARASSALRRKPSKWRKIGGMFKAKNAMSPKANKPFYQVRAGQTGPEQGSTHSVDYKSRRGSETKTGPIENTEVWPCLVSENEALTHQGQSKPPAGSLLQVEIPQIAEMERYSVMFGGLLNKSQPSLLDRRSKTLDNLTITGKESPPPGPQRRATSPALSKSPNFTLFPTMPASKASKVLGSHNLPQGPNPRPRTQGSLANQSQETLLAQRNLSPDIHPKASHRSQGSVTSFLSSTSIGSNDEPLLIHKIEPVRTYAGMKEPNWVMVNRNPPTPSQSDSPSKKKLTINTREIHSRSDSTSSSESTLTSTSLVSSASSPILSPLNTTRTGASPPRTQNGLDTNSQGPAQNPKPISFPPPRTSSRTNDQSPSSNHSHKASNSQTEIPTIEVSIARSVSVSKGKKQMLVPVRTRAPTFNLSQAKTPQVSGPQVGHRPGLSQDARIEMV